MMTLCGSIVCGGLSGILGYYTLPEYWASCAVLGLAGKCQNKRTVKKIKKSL
jgi:hypothetical protein